MQRYCFFLTWPNIWVKKCCYRCVFIKMRVRKWTFQENEGSRARIALRKMNELSEDRWTRHGLPDNKQWNLRGAGLVDLVELVGLVWLVWLVALVTLVELARMQKGNMRVAWGRRESSERVGRGVRGGSKGVSRGPDESGAIPCKNKGGRHGTDASLCIIRSIIL